MIFANVLSTNKELMDAIKNIFFEVFPNLDETNFSWEKEQKDYDNWDSFTQLNLITLAEAKFDITFSLDESISIKSANDLLKTTKSQLT